MLVRPGEEEQEARVQGVCVSRAGTPREAPGGVVRGERVHATLLPRIRFCGGEQPDPTLPFHIYFPSLRPVSPARETMPALALARAPVAGRSARRAIAVSAASKEDAPPVAPPALLPRRAALAAVLAGAAALAVSAPPR